MYHISHHKAHRIQHEQFQLLNPKHLGSLLKDYAWSQGNFVKETVTSDGSLMFEYNLAGYRNQDIAIQFDTITQELLIKAYNKAKDREFSTIVALPPYTETTDILVHHEQGMLTIKIKDFTQKRESFIVDIPLYND